MTQKEYNKKLSELKEENTLLKKEIESIKSKTYNYEVFLERYYVTNEELKQEKEYNRQNVLTIERLQNTINQYEKILNRFSINCD